MGIHNSPCHFNQLSDMTGQQKLTKSHLYRHINGISDKITALYASVQIIAIGLFHKIQTVISRRNRHIVKALSLSLV